MSNYLSEKSIEKYNDDLSIVKHLFGESFIYSKIIFGDENTDPMMIHIGNKINYPLTNKLCVVIPPLLEIQYSNYNIEINYATKRSSTVTQNIILSSRKYKLGLSREIMLLNGAENIRIINPILKTITLIENDRPLANEANNFLKSIDANFIGKYTTLIRCCFDLMGG
jgi:hypothetical protein